MGMLAFVLTNLPAILKAILGVEDAIKSAPGTTKKQIVLSSITAAAEAGETVSDAKVAAVSKIIDNTVSALNSAGIFTKNTGTGTGAAAPSLLKVTATLKI